MEQGGSHSHSTPSSYALGRTFTPKKASHMFGVEHKMASHPTFSLYEIDPWGQFQFLEVF